MNRPFHPLPGHFERRYQAKHPVDDTVDFHPMEEFFQIIEQYVSTDAMVLWDRGLRDIPVDRCALWVYRSPWRTILTRVPHRIEEHYGIQYRTGMFREISIHHVVFFQPDHHQIRAWLGDRWEYVDSKGNPQ